MKIRKTNYFLEIKRFLFSINALLYRELKTRISKSTIGLIGVFVEPSITLLVFIAIFSLRRGSDVFGLNIYVFLTAGISIFSLFNSIAYRSANAIEGNRGLIGTYKYIKIIDTVIARSIIEFFLTLIFMIVILSSVFLYKSQIILSSIHLSISILFLSLTFSFGVGLIILVVSNLYPITKLLLPFITRPLFIGSCVFFPLLSIPQGLRKYLLWNPLLHFIELFRNSFDNNYPLDKMISISYASYSATTTLVIGLALYSLFENELLKK